MVVPELVGTILVMAIKPFFLLKLSCMTALRGAFIVINTWVEILSASIYFHVSIFWRFMFWVVSLITLPARAVVALRREKQLQAQVRELQDIFDSLAWDRKKLHEHIQIANKEHEMMLGELEDEHDEAINKIKLLEAELQDLKNENFRLKEVHCKSHWDTGTRVGAGYDYGQKDKDAVKAFNTKDEGFSWKSDHYNPADILTHKETFKDENKGTFETKDFIKDNGAPLMHRMIPGVITRSAYMDDVLGRRREVAVSQSLFSTILSLLVGMIIWEAEDPCMPLVTALFMVVGMSLLSVVQFFSTINNKPASDAVALLSLNWFILGTVTYPTLPRVARFLAPILIKTLERVLGGFHCPLVSRSLK